MSIAIIDRTSVNATIKKGKKYNDVTSPDNKIVDVESNNRHRLLSAMFPDWSPAVERLVEFMMAQDDAHFRLLCHHDSGRYRLSRSKLDVISEALEESRRRHETLEINLTEIDDISMEGPSDTDLKVIEMGM